MVKLKSKQRIIDLRGMLDQATFMKIKLPKMQLEYNKLKARQLKGNKELFRF